MTNNEAYYKNRCLDEHYLPNCVMYDECSVTEMFRIDLSNNIKISDELEEAIFALLKEGCRQMLGG